MQYVNFFGHKVSKLIVGDNPFNGWSYIPEVFTKEDMVQYYTEDKILETIHHMEELGVNTMLPLADPYIIRILQHYRANGGKMQFIFQSYSPIMPEASFQQMMSVEPIGAYVSGTFNDLNHELGDDDAIPKQLEKFKSMGIPIGLGTHYPELVQKSEAENWNPDFYVTCLYNFRRGRAGEQSGFITGKKKTGIAFCADDRQVMLDVLKDIEKPVLAFKLFGGGKVFLNKTEEEKRAAIKDAYNATFTALKPDDFGAIGVFQKYTDQLEENIAIFNEWCQEQNL